MNVKTAVDCLCTIRQIITNNRDEAGGIPGALAIHMIELQAGLALDALADSGAPEGAQPKVNVAGMAQPTAPLTDFEIFALRELIKKDARASAIARNAEEQRKFEEEANAAFTRDYISREEKEATTVPPGETVQCEICKFAFQRPRKQAAQCPSCGAVYELPGDRPLTARRPFGARSYRGQEAIQAAYEEAHGMPPTLPNGKTIEAEAPSGSIWEALARRLYRDHALRSLTIEPPFDALSTGQKHEWFKRAAEVIDASPDYLQPRIYRFNHKPHEVLWNGEPLS